MDISIRNAELDDLSEILRLNQELFNFEEQFHHQYNLEWTYSEIGKSYFHGRFANENAIIYVAVVKERIVGYILATINRYSYRRINPICDIENVFVEELFRKKGIGSKLIEAVRITAKEKGAKRLRVNAIAQNEKALSFYRKHGFGDIILYLEENLS